MSCLGGKGSTMSERLKGRFAEAYLTMAREAKYRPAAPGDGLGGIYLSDEELEDPERLEEEAWKYAERFLAEEERRTFPIGRSNWRTNRALVLVVEAARLLCAGGDEYAVKLLGLALREVEGAAEVVWRQYQIDKQT